MSDPQLLRTAAGCFGLLGVVTAVTFRLDRMSHARMVSRKPRVALTIPPPPGATLPPQVDMSGISQTDLDAAFADFVRRCENDYYAEWFWFPYHQQGWINTWNNDGDAAQSQGYPTPSQEVLEEATLFLAGLASQTLFQLLPGRIQAQLWAATAMLALPERSDANPLITSVSDALHFRRGIQNMRCWDLELEIPVSPRADDPAKLDWSICQKAWWSAISRIYQRPDAPMRIALEMRVMGGSDAALAAQRGNRATCSIEVLTSMNVKSTAWHSFRQELTDDWCALTDGTGAALQVRPHWSKEWQDLSMNGQPAVTHLKHSCAAQIADFRAGLEAIALFGGYTLPQLKARFGNPLLDDLLEDALR